MMNYLFLIMVMAAAFVFYHSYTQYVHRRELNVLRSKGELERKELLQYAAEEKRMLIEAFKSKNVQEFRNEAKGAKRSVNPLRDKIGEAHRGMEGHDA